MRYHILSITRSGMLAATLSGFLGGIAFILIHSCISKSLADGGVVFDGADMRSYDPDYRREMLELKSALVTYDVHEIDPDNSKTWYRLITKDIASNMRLLNGIGQEPLSPKKRAVGADDGDLIPKPVLCVNPGEFTNTSGCPGYQHSPIIGLPAMAGFGESVHEDCSSDSDGLSGRISPEEYRELQRTASLSAAAYISDEEILSISKLLETQVRDFPIVHTQPTRKTKGISPTVFRIWRFRDSLSTIYVSFLGLADKTVHFSGIDTELSPLHTFNPLPSTPSKRRFPEVAESGPQIHKGFLHEYSLLEEQLLTLLNQFNYRDEIERIVFTGHSIGGAVAIIAGSVARSYYPDTRIDVITFGAPRVGDELFVEQFAEKVSVNTRVVLKGDLIPLVYPIGPAFEHVSGWLCLDCGDPEYRDFAPGSRIRLALKSLGRTSLSVHNMKWYLRSLKVEIDYVQ